MLPPPPPLHVTPPPPPSNGNVSHAERLHQLEWWECVDADATTANNPELLKHARIYQRLRAQHQTVEAFCQVPRGAAIHIPRLVSHCLVCPLMLTWVPLQAQHRAHHDEGYDLNKVAGIRPKVSEPAMRPRQVTVGEDYHGRPYTMTYFHVEEVLASMRTEAPGQGRVRRRGTPAVHVHGALSAAMHQARPRPSHGVTTERERVCPGHL